MPLLSFWGHERGCTGMQKNKRRTLTTTIDIELIRQVRALSFELGMRMNDIIEQALKKYIDELK